MATHLKTKKAKEQMKQTVLNPEYMKGVKDAPRYIQRPWTNPSNCPYHR